MVLYAIGSVASFSLEHRYYPSLLDLKMLLALPLVLALMLGDHAALLLVLLATGSVSAAGSSTDAWV